MTFGLNVLHLLPPKKIIDPFHYLVMNTWQLTMNQIANAISTSCKRAENILYNELWRGKVFYSVCTTSTDLDQKCTRLITPWAKLTLFEAGQSSWLSWSWWLHHFELETKKQSMQRKQLSSHTPKKAKVVSSAGELMALVSGVMQKTIHIDLSCLSVHIVIGFYMLLTLFIVE